MSRQAVITGSGAGAAEETGTVPEAAPAHGGGQNFLFVHGAWHSPMHWNEVVERVVARGHRAFAVDLPGSGLKATYPASYLRNDFTTFATEPLGS